MWHSRPRLCVRKDLPMMRISNQMFIGILFILSVCLLFDDTVLAAADPNKPAAPKESSAKQITFPEPLVNPRALLIRDDTIRMKLDLDAEAVKKLDALCDRLDPVLFAMRDVPAGSTDPAALQRRATIQKELKALAEIMTATQRQRLDELTVQYHGYAAMLWPGVAERLQLTQEQLLSINKILTDTAKKIEGLKNSKASQDKQSSAREYLSILRQQEQQISEAITLKQQMLWQKMIGRQFDFSVLKPFIFRAPELTDITTWINSRPLTLAGLDGKVVIVHFWTFGCANCINNYPAYKRWLEKYNSGNVVMIGIHTPETPAEESVEKITAAAKENGLKFAIAVDNSKANWNRWNNTIWPAVYLVDKKGKVRFWWYGELGWQGAKGEQWITDKIDMLMRE
jgi:thiol-disulfide isomerase/thioredoxin